MRKSPHIAVVLTVAVLAGLVVSGCANSRSGTAADGDRQPIETPTSSSTPAPSTSEPLIGDNPSPILTGVVEYANGEVRALGTLEKLHGAGSAKWVIRDTLPFMSRGGTIIAILDLTDSPVPESELEKSTYVMATGKLGIPPDGELPIAPVIKLEALREVEMPVESP